MKFRKKPVLVSAVQFEDTPDGRAKIARFAGDFVYAVIPGRCQVRTPNGLVILAHGDWIVCESATHYHPVKPDVFGAQYEAL